MMNFEYTLFHPNGEIKVKVTGATANAAMATVQMGHEIVAMMGGNVAGQAPVEIAPEPAPSDEELFAKAFDTPMVSVQPEQVQGITVDGNPYPATNNGPEEVPQVDSAGTPFDPELHTGTLKKDGTWRLKKGAASKVEETESEEVDEGEPEGNEPAAGATSPKEAPAEGAETPATSSPEVGSDGAEITDTELQRYCGRLVQHFGKSDPVFDLAKMFVPEGEMPRPTMIKDQAKRREFIAKAQEQTGVIYHG